MDYVKISIEINMDAAEIMGGILISNGIESWEIEDGLPVLDPYMSKLYPELAPDIDNNDKCIISLFFEDTEDYRGILCRVLEDAKSNDIVILDGDVKEEIIRESSWRNKWKEYFHSFDIDKIRIVPSWEEYSENLDEKILVRIDPGISFGTGTHESTRLCIRGLIKHLKEEDRVLDIGFGSGILSIVSLKLGASFVEGVDIDPDCMIAVNDNYQKNELSMKNSNFYIGDLLKDSKLAQKLEDNSNDILVTNILADIIIDLLPIIIEKVKIGGKIIASGIIDFKLESIIEKFKANHLDVIEIAEDGEWRMVCAVRKE